MQMPPFSTTAPVRLTQPRFGSISGEENFKARIYLQDFFRSQELVISAGLPYRDDDPRKGQDFGRIRLGLPNLPPDHQVPLEETKAALRLLPEFRETEDGMFYKNIRLEFSYHPQEQVQQFLRDSRRRKRTGPPLISPPNFPPK